MDSQKNTVHLDINTSDRNQELFFLAFLPIRLVCELPFTEVKVHVKGRLCEQFLYLNDFYMKMMKDWIEFSKWKVDGKVSSTKANIVL